ncbi:MAG: hypothetical protein E7598_07610 [Ruminococcaceae bacterium]|nr:hypothetical protein [Oscillospiraceae bacterium]
MKARSTKKALLASLLSLVVCVSLLVGSTFAWFTDSVTSAQNVIQSGNLDVELYYTYDAAVAGNVNSDEWVKVGSTTDVFGYNLWEPGFTKVAYFKVVNEGSLALKYKLSADVYEEVEGKNQEGEKFLLSDHIKTALVPVGATRDQILAMEGTNLKASFGMSAEHLTAKGTATATKVVGMALWMPTTVGNEANHNGTDVPSITFGINLIATQDTVESDSFGSDYDTEAVYPNITFPSIVTGNKAVDKTGNTTNYEIHLYSPELNDEGEYASQGSVDVPKDAVDPNADEIEIDIKKLSEADSSVPVGSNEEATTLDITVEGIKAGNTTPITVTAHIGTNLGNIKLYHKNQQIDYISYSNSNGILVFTTTSFSPFTVVYDGEAPAYTDEVIPQAVVTDVSATYAGKWGTAEGDTETWKGFDGFIPIGEQDLDAVYKFVAPHDSDTVKDSKYREWECDYYVMLKSDKLTSLPEGSIALGGNYGSYGWVGFFNPEVETNVEIPLLGSVVEIPWTYEGVVGFVGQFLCGVGVNPESTTDLTDADFVVMLRLTNPETKEFVNVNTVTYNFASNTSTIETDNTVFTPVYSTEELMQAIAEGKNPVLMDDIDLGNGSIVIP